MTPVTLRGAVEVRSYRIDLDSVAGYLDADSSSPTLLLRGRELCVSLPDSERDEVRKLCDHFSDPGMWDAYERSLLWRDRASRAPLWRVLFAPGSI